MKISYLIQTKFNESWVPVGKTSILTMREDLEECKTDRPNDTFRVIQRIEAVEEIVLLS